MGTTSLAPLNDIVNYNTSTQTFPTQTAPATGYSSTLGNVGVDMLFNPKGLSSAVNAAIPAQMGPTVEAANGLGNVPGLENYYDQAAESSKYWLDKNKAFDNSFMGQASPYLKGFSTLTQGLGSLASIYSGFKMMDMYGDQLDIAKDQWATTKQELARVQGVRNKLNAEY